MSKGTKIHGGGGNDPGEGFARNIWTIWGKHLLFLFIYLFLIWPFYLSTLKEMNELNVEYLNLTICSTRHIHTTGF